jgi:hypothetical protein
MTKEVLSAADMEATRVRNEFISKWGADTISTFEKSIKTHRPSDLLCITTLSICSTYCNAIVALLQNGLRMPTKALLRILFEVSAKVLWCLAPRTTDEPESAVEERITGWAKAALQQDIKLRRGYLTIVAEEKKADVERQIKDSEEKLGQLECDPMPRTFLGLLKECGDSWHKKFYPPLYMRFNNAIHLDFGSLCNKAKDDGSTVSVTDDSTEPIEELAKCWAFNMLTIFVAIRAHYEWDIEEMRSEYRAMNQSDDT